MEQAVYDPINLTRACVQVFVGSYIDPEKVLKALFNPETLRISLGVSIGKLHPVGSSHPVLQYGYTEGVGLPIELYFSTQLLMRLKGTTLDLASYVNWFSSFCYPRQKGGAPELLHFVWPEVLDMVLAVEKFSAEYVRFYREDLRPMAVKVTIDTAEYRMDFKSSWNQKTEGFSFGDEGLTKYAGTGAKMRLGKM